ncbi:unnamed protein product [Gongylonema pulchrum]|uniref:CTNNB1_binding domain-containing protein n=1 Tax=Gongylonema pulchrum TaxID=637853 RepID=A0A183EQE7_9BILA|nr:unnamed protein product [Gongylonema pulchrum]
MAQSTDDQQQQKEQGALIVDSQYESEDQQFLEELHLASSNQCSASSDHEGSFCPPETSKKSYAQLQAVKTEPMDYEEQTFSDSGSFINFSCFPIRAG